MPENNGSDDTRTVVYLLCHSITTAAAAAAVVFVSTVSLSASLKLGVRHAHRILLNSKCTSKMYIIESRVLLEY